MGFSMVLGWESELSKFAGAGEVRDDGTALAGGVAAVLALDAAGTC